MQKKMKLLKRCAKLLKKPSVTKWYAKNLENTPQVDTITTLLQGIVRGELTTKEALCIALIVGVQWNVKFKDAEL